MSTPSVCGQSTREPGGARGLREEPTKEALALGRGCLPYVENTVTATRTPDNLQNPRILCFGTHMRCQHSLAGSEGMSHYTKTTTCQQPC